MANIYVNYEIILLDLQELTLHKEYVRMIVMKMDNVMKVSAIVYQVSNE
jgi:hypothetical protein